MSVDLFAVVHVTDYPAALAWYERLFGFPVTFHPNDREAVWELAEHRYIVIEHLPEHAGHARNTVFVDDLDSRVAGITERGIEPAHQETYENGVRKISYHDADGNETSYGGGPQ